MKTLIAKKINTYIDIRGETEIEDIEYQKGELKITLNYYDATKKALVSFKEIIGFRVLDEGDLLEFWPTCSMFNGWIFKILDGGWNELESTRSGFLSKDTRKYTEYLITGIDDCINVFSVSPPIIREL